MGGAIFVASGGSLTIAGASNESGGAVTAGAGSRPFESGSAFDAGIFYEGGANGAVSTLTFGAGNQSYADAIGDLNAAAGVTTTNNGLGGTGGITALAKTGGGTLTLSGASTYTGGTTIAGGTLDIAQAIVTEPGGVIVGPVGSGAITFSGTSSSPAELMLEGVAQPTSGSTFATTLVNFGDDDTLDLKGLAFTDAGPSTPIAVSNNTLTVSENDTTESFTLGGAGMSTYYAESDGSGGTLVTDTPVCFAAGTRIRIARRGGVIADLAVEDLAVGDLALTSSGLARPIRWLGHRRIDCRAHPRPHEAHPIRIAAHAFGDNRPTVDLYLSPGHPVLVGGNADDEGGCLVPIMCLINGTTVRRVAVDSVTYWHVELDQHDILLAEGLPAESFLDCGCRSWFEDGADHALANPDFIVPGLGARCRAVAIGGPIVEAERRRIDAVFAMSLVAQCDWPAAESVEWHGRL